MIRRQLILFFSLMMVWITPALAQDASMNANPARPGVYLGVGGFYAIEDFDTSQGVKVDNSAGFNFRLGYRFTPHVAVEAMGERVDDFDLKRSVGRNVEIWTGTVNGKFFLLTDRLQPYGLLGIGFLQGNQKNRPGFASDPKDTGLAFRYGGGLDAYMTKNWLLNLEVSYVHPPSDDVRRLNYVSLGGGIQYRF